MNFEDCFRTDVLVDFLCRDRIKVAARRHRQELFGDAAHASSFEGELADAFPPRSGWLRPVLNARGEHHQYVALRRAVDRGLKVNPSAPWAVRLVEVVEEIRAKALSATPTFAAPDFILRPKGDGRVRALAVYPVLDRLVMSQTAKYIGRKLDSVLAPNVFGHRMGFSTARLTHHDAMLSLLSYRQAHAGERLWVSEADLVGFFDCVPHKVVREAFASAVARVRKTGMAVDEQALSVLKAMLVSYTFTGVAVPAVTALLVDGQRFDSHEHELKDAWSGRTVGAVGLPQGSALSGVAANLVLAAADRAVLAAGGTELFYARYIDDVLIAHPSRKVCADAFEAYLNAAEKLRLPVHPPREVRDYDARLASGASRFWSYKSRKPYAWEAGGTTRVSAPWVGFVGYQVRHDGMLRVRPSSIHRHIDQQVTEASRAIRAVEAKVPSVNARWRRRLSWWLVGHLSVKKQAWSKGFRLLRSFPHLEGQLRQMDRHHGRLLNRVARRLRQLPGTAVRLAVKLNRYTRSYVGLLALDKTH